MAQVDRLGRVLVTVVVVVVLVCPAGRAQLVWCLLPCIPAEEEPAICRACSMIESNWFGKKVLWFFFLLLLLLLVRKQQRSRRVVFRLRIQWAKLASIQRLVVEVGNGIPIPIPIPRFESDRPPLVCVSFSCLVFARHCSYCHPATDWRQTTQFEGDRFSSSFQFSG